MHEKMFESRMFFVDKLIGMGARIVLCDPHRALVAGPSELPRGDGRVSGHSGGDGDPAGGPVRARHEHHQQRATDRPRL